MRRFNFTAFAISIFLLSIFFAVVTARALYDDGSYYFMRTLQAHGFADIVFSRNYADYLYQLPLVIALHCGITDLATLQLFFGLGCFIAWPLILWLCWRLAPQHFWIVVLACGAGYLNAAFSAVAEHIVAHAFFWPACFVIFFVRPLTRFAAATLLGSAFILVCSYESMMFLGPLLAWLAIRRSFIEEKESWSRIVFLLAGILFLASYFVAVDGTFHPGHGGNANSFKIGVLSVARSPGWTIPWTLALTFFMFAGCFSAKIRAVTATRVGIILLGGIILVWGFWPLLAPAQLDVYKQYEARFLDLLVPLALFVVAGAQKYFAEWFNARKKFLVNFSAALLLAQSLWQLSATEQWRGFLNVLRDLMAARPGTVKLMDTPYGRQPAVGRQATQFVWVMDLRNLCLEIGPPKVQALVLGDPFIDSETVNRDMLEQYNPKALPDLQRYGVNYETYVRAYKPEDLTFTAPAKK